jgi:hypothetical protein
VAGRDCNAGAGMIMPDKIEIDTPAGEFALRKTEETNPLKPEKKMCLGSG